MLSLRRAHQKGKTGLFARYQNKNNSIERLTALQGNFGEIAKFLLKPSSICVFLS